MARGDSAKDVRAGATKSFNLTHATLPVLLANTRDSAFEVRVAAIERLGREVAAETLAVPQRAALVTRALSDRQPAVVAQGRWLVVQCWLKRCSWDPLQVSCCAEISGRRRNLDLRQSRRLPTFPRSRLLPPQVLNLMDCDGLDSMEYASHGSAKTPAALVAHTILDVVDDFDAPAKDSRTTASPVRPVSRSLRPARSIFPFLLLSRPPPPPQKKTSYCLPAAVSRGPRHAGPAPGAARRQGPRRLEARA